jgi:fructoselysine-6-P-deglycase FrlB-like protein
MTAFDPTAPLAPMPSPWAFAGRPSHRDGPPYHMTDMIAAQPHVARRLLDRLAPDDSAAARLAGAIGQAAMAGETVVLTGCGTSEHGALAGVEILREAMRAGGLPHGPGAIVAAQAFELALDPPSTGLVIGISHEGGTAATNAALGAAREAGARTAIITASAESPAAGMADAELVIDTVELDHGWCHVIGYSGPLIAAVAVGAHVSGRPLDVDAVVEPLEVGAGEEATAEAAAGALAGANTLLAVASGADRPAARELALKVEEATWLPSATRDLETFLHGHLPSTDETTGLVLLLTDRQAREARVARARDALAAARVVGVRAAGILARDVAGEIPEELTPAGRIVVEEAPGLPSPVAALVGTVAPLQHLTERLARARGTNPDSIRRDDPRYRGAAAAAE